MSSFDRLTHLEQTLDRLYEQLAGLESAWITAEQAEKVRLRQRIQDLKTEIAGFEQEKAQLLNPQPNSQPNTPALPLRFSSYNPATFTGREQEIATLLAALDQGKRLLWIVGLTGIGKTTLGERIAAEALGDRSYLAIDCQRDFKEGDFIQGAIVLLEKLGDETAQQLPEDQMLPYLVQTLSQGAYWVQMDSVEALVRDGDFGDERWGTFLEQGLRGDLRLVLTTQAFPQDWDGEGRWRGAVETVNLEGLEPDRVLELFGRSGVVAQSETEEDYLLQIAQDFQQHPFILQITAGEMKLRPFNGDVGRYWREYYQQERQQRPKLRQSQRSQIEARVQRVLEQLPTVARRLLLAGSVLSRAVPEEFYRGLLPEVPAEEREAALELLIARELVQERDLSGSSWLLGQHNLVREGALAGLRQDAGAWESAHRQAAELWLNHYEPGENASNLDRVRGYLEALEHYVNIGDYQETIQLPSTKLKNGELLHYQLYTWSLFREKIQLHTSELPQYRTKKECRGLKERQRWGFMEIPLNLETPCSIVKS